MIWFIVILVVLAMGGVALVAAGQGAPMVDEYDDRPDVLVPADRPLEAADLRRVRFSLAFRGYRMSEVDALLDRLAREQEDRAAWIPEATDHQPDQEPDQEPDPPADDLPTALPPLPVIEPPAGPQQG